MATETGFQETAFLKIRTLSLVLSSSFMLEIPRRHLDILKFKFAFETITLRRLSEMEV